MESVSPSSPIAIIGIGCLFPKADNLEQYWANIKNGVDAITDVPPTHWRPSDYFNADPKKPDLTYAARGGFLSPVDFPPLEYGITPNALEATDTSQLLGMVVARQALADAGYGPDRLFDRDRVSVILGVTGTLELVIPLGARLGHPIWRRALKEAGVADDVANEVVERIGDSYVGWQENSFPGLLGNVVAGRIANKLDLGGTNCVVDAACASSLSAVHLAMLELQAGRSDMVLTGGVDTFNDIFMYMCFSKTPALSPTGNAKPFDAQGDGTILGEGLGMLVLKRLPDAERDGDRIYAVIRGLGSSSDGKGNAIYAPRAAGQQKALREAYRQANVTPDTIELIEAHGTGTKAGDATEVSALVDVYQNGHASAQWCAVGSVKSQIGHTKAAAGAAGLIKAALALDRKVLPPTIKVQQPLEQLGAEQSPFYVNTAKRPWLPSSKHPRRAAISSFGFGGSNFHCVLEEYRPAKDAIDWDGSVEIVALSENSAAGLKTALDSLSRCKTWNDWQVAGQQSRQAFRMTDKFRLVLVLERDKADAGKLLAAARSLLEKQPGKRSWSTPDGIYFGQGPVAGRLGALFPGQGSQYAGMMRDLVCQFPAILETLGQAEDVFGGPLCDFIYPKSAFTDAERQRNEEQLRATNVAQPAIGAVSLGGWRVLEHLGVQADAVAGHSYGELTALCVSGRFDSQAFFALSKLRGQLMAEGSGDRGSMLAVRATLDVVNDILKNAKLDIVIANKNAPAQAVLSGPTESIRKAEVLFAERKIQTHRLPVSAAFHSALVADVRERFLPALQQTPIKATRVPVFANTTGAEFPADADAARTLLAEQLAKPVEFVREIEAMYQAGVRTFLEVGPGNKVTGLVRAILDGKEHEALALDASSGQRSGTVDLARALAQLAAVGHAVELSRWEPAVKAPPVADGKATLTVPIGGANYVKPKTPKPPRPQPAPVANTTAKPQAAQKMEQPPMSTDPSFMAQAMKMSQDNLIALQKLSEQTAQLHRQFLEGQDRAQQTFRSLLEQQQRLFLGAPGQSALPPEPLPAPTPPVSATSITPPKIEPVETAPPPIAAKAMPIAKSAPASNGQVAVVLLAVVAEKTGYPAEMLNLDMALDADLGIDSIKRVEILSALQEKLPGAPAVKPEHLGKFHRLQDVVDFLGPTYLAPGEPPGAEPAVTTLRADDEISTTLLAVVADKTGYPTEMLNLEMTLDADLGIDSIKRVEILSALQEKLPNAPTVKPEHLGTLHTLGQIVSFLSAGAAEQPKQSFAEVRSQTGVWERGASERVSQLLLTVVADKTGYPPEMLNLDMTLDADLGIDSIKRVEILSAIQEKLPDAPPVKPEHMGTMHTLRHIVAFLSAPDGERSAHLAPGEPPVAAPAAIKCQPAQIDSIDRLILTKVALPNADQRKSIILPPGSEIWITSEGGDLAEALARRLDLLGYRPRLVSIHSESRPAQLGGLILVAPNGPVGDEFLKSALKLLQLAATSLRTAGTSVFATIARLDGAFGLDRFGDSLDSTAGGLAGLTKTAGHEWPEVNCKALDVAADLDDAEEAALLVSEELLKVGPPEVGIAAAGNCCLELAAACLTETAGAKPLERGDVVVITGGARGVTAEVAVALAKTYGPKLVLLGRSPKPAAEPTWLQSLIDETDIKKALLAHANGQASPKLIGDQYRTVLAGREIAQNLARMASAGATVDYRSVDVRDPAAVRSILREIRSEFGPIRGFIHGAGVLADKRIEEKTAEQFDLVYGTKVAGLRAALAELPADELRALVLFSSSTGRFGRTGQVDYAIANEVLNKMAQQEARRRPGCRVLSVNWGPWDGGMVTPALKQLFAKEGVGVIPLEAGAQHLVRELGAAEKSPVEIVILGKNCGTGFQSCDIESDRIGILSHGQPAMSLVLERQVDVASLPILQAHVLNGKAVMPMALILEWLAHAAAHGNPGLAFHGFNDLRILKGVVLDGDQPQTLRLYAGRAVKQDAVFVVPVELRGWAHDKERVHARADILLTSKLPAGKAALPPVAGDALEFDKTALYEEYLFHAAELRGIEKVVACSPQGIEAVAAAAPLPAAWLKQPLRSSWFADPLALDCSFQMMIVWSFERHGAGSLPCAAARYRQYRRAFPRDGVRVVIQVTKDLGQRALATMEFVDAKGELIARMEDYECVIDPSLREAFRRNSLRQAATV